MLSLFSHYICGQSEKAVVYKPEGSSHQKLTMLAPLPWISHLTMGMVLEEIRGEEEGGREKGIPDKVLVNIKI